MLINLKLHQLGCQVVSNHQLENGKKMATNQDSALRTTTATLGNLFESTRSVINDIIPLISIIIIISSSPPGR